MSHLFIFAAFLLATAHASLHELNAAVRTGVSTQAQLLERRDMLHSLMLSDPAQAYSIAASLESSRSSFSAASLTHIESPISGFGDIEHICAHVDAASGPPRAPNGVSAEGPYGACSFLLTLNGKSYNINLEDGDIYKDFSAHFDVAVQGYALNGNAVLRKSHAVQLQSNTRSFKPMACSTNTGTKSAIPKLPLYLQVDFADKQGMPITSAQMNVLAGKVSDFFTSTSYGQITIGSPTITQVFRMPSNTSVYVASYNQLRTDALAAFASAGGEACSFDFQIICFPTIGYGWAGLGSVGGKSTWINGYYGDGKVVAHELGHNLVLPHASLWISTDGRPLSAGGNSNEYGDSFDVMGGGNPPLAHYQALYKAKLNWFTPTKEFTSLSVNKTEWIGEIWPHDDITARGNMFAVSVLRSNSLPAGYEFWISTRNKAASIIGQLQVHLAFPKYAIPGSNMLDIHPATSTLSDSGIFPGESFSDCPQNITITNAGFAPCSTNTNLKCVTTIIRRAIPSTTFLGLNINPSIANKTFAVNETFSATASVLPATEGVVYGWRMGDGTTYSTASISHKYTTAGFKTVVATVTDTKGRMTQWSFWVLIGTAAASSMPSATALGAASYQYTCAASYQYQFAGSSDGSGGNAVATPEWVSSVWGPCSLSCGGGVSTRTVTCVKAGVPVEDAQCAGLIKPVTSSTCNTQVCSAYDWALSAWSACSKPCGNGTQIRSAKCIVSKGADYGTAATDADCVAGPSSTGAPGPFAIPITVQPCNTFACSNNTTNSTTNTVAPLFISVAMGSIAYPGEVTTITWNMTGDASFLSLIKFVDIYAYHPNEKYGTLVGQSVSNTGKYGWIINMDHIEGLHTINVVARVPTGVVLPRGSVTFASSNSFEIPDACRVIAINCGVNGKCFLGKCACKAGYTGSECELETACVNKDCSGRGNCTVSTSPFDGSKTGVCVCNAGYTGVNCGTNKQCPTSASTTINVGNTTITQNTTVATCANGYQDSTCTCRCATNWAGTSCDRCTLSCGLFGTPNIGCSRCVCDKNYKGSMCNLRYYFFSLKLKYNVSKISGNLTTSTELKTLMNNLVNEVAFALNAKMVTSSSSSSHFATLADTTPAVEVAPVQFSPDSSKDTVTVTVELRQSSTGTSADVQTALSNIKAQSSDPTSTLLSNGETGKLVDTSSFEIVDTSSTSAASSVPYMSASVIALFSVIMALLL